MAKGEMKYATEGDMTDNERLKTILGGAAQVGSQGIRQQTIVDGEARRRLDAASLAWACELVKREADLVTCGGGLAFSHEAGLTKAISVLRLAIETYEAKRGST